jgi:hypothetical protein
MTLKQEGRELLGDVRVEDPVVSSAFVEEVTVKKRVCVETLAAAHSMSFAVCKATLERFVEGGQLFGVFDGWGSFVVVSPGELQQAAQYITSKGRVTFDELARRALPA